MHLNFSSSYDIVMEQRIKLRRMRGQAVFMSEANAEKQSEQHIVIPVEWSVPDAMKNIYADTILAQPRIHDIIISFFETQPPILGGDIEKNRLLLQQLRSIRAECVGKFVVAADLVPEIIRVLQTAYDGYLAAREKPEDV